MIEFDGNQINSVNVMPLICRSCLIATSNMLNINQPITIESNNYFSNTTYMDYLNYYLRIEIDNDMPAHFCSACGSSLKVAYAFMKNTSNAQQIFRSLPSSAEEQANPLPAAVVSNEQLTVETIPNQTTVDCSYHCGVCNEEFIDDNSLVEHMKLHSDVLINNCELCEYRDTDLSNLCEHYLLVHNIQSIRYDLQPPPNSSASISDDSQKIEAVSNLEETPILPIISAKDINYETILRVKGGIETIISATGKRRESLLQEIAVPFEKVCSFNPNKPNTLQTDSNSELITKPNENTNLEPAKNVIVIYTNIATNPANLPEEIASIDKGQTTTPNEGVIIEELGQTDVNEIIIDERENCSQIQPVLSAPVEVIPVQPIQPIQAIPTVTTNLQKVKYCQICLEEFSTQSDVINHILSQHVINLNQNFENNDNLQATGPELQTENQQLQEEQQQPQEQQELERENYQQVQIQQVEEPLIEQQGQQELESESNPHQQLQIEEQQQEQTEQFDLQADIPQQQHTQRKRLSKPHEKQKRRVQSEEQVPVFSCDLCVFETNVEMNLKNHYLFNHCIQANAVQMRPVIKQAGSEQATSKIAKKTNAQLHILRCFECPKIFISSKKLYEHYKEKHNDDSATNLQSLPKPTVNSLLYSIGNAKILNSNTVTIGKCHIIKPIRKTTINIKDNSGKALTTVRQQSFLKPILAVPTNTKTINVNLTLPAVTVSTSSGAHTEAVKDVFINEGDDDDDDDVQVVGESHINDLEDLDLTTDGFDTDANSNDCIEVKVEANPTLSQISKLKIRYCPHCHKSFRTQYKFENHSYIHRNLAPFRCILCTNKYNTKQSLIRHYRGIHKYIPTRDMVQAKGEKFSNIAEATVTSAATATATATGQTQRRMQTRMQTQTQTQTSSLYATRFKKTNILMCSCCSFESEDFCSIISHLNIEHGLRDEIYILRKLPFECPKCMRSFSNKMLLIRHLQSKHNDLSIKKQECSTEQLLEEQNRGKQIQQSRTSHKVGRTKASPMIIGASNIRKRGKVYKLNWTI